MSPTWHAEDPPPDPVRITPAGAARVVLRGVPLAMLVFGGLGLHLLVRLVEYPVFGMHRPVTPWITRFVCRNALRLMGIRFEVNGQVMQYPGALVANHSTWLDIFTLNARAQIYFVSKAEVAGWPAIGWLAKATGTVFIDRNPRQARDHADTLTQRLAAGHRLLFFPEGTSTDGQRVLPFRTTLFAAFFDDGLRDQLWVQPVTARYIAPQEAPARFYGWWGDMGFAPDLVKILAQAPQGRVVVTYHPPLRVADFNDRKSLAQASERAVRDGLLSHGTP